MRETFTKLHHKFSDKKEEKRYFTALTNYTKIVFLFKLIFKSYFYLFSTNFFLYFLYTLIDNLLFSLYERKFI